MTGMGTLTSLAREMPAPVCGAAWMLLGAAAFAVTTALIRVCADALHPFEVAFFRNLFGLVLLLPWLARRGIGTLRTRRIGVYALRAAIGLAAMLCWFTGIAMMPIAEATALSFTSPLFASLAAVLALGETMRLRRTAALIAGFAGALIILRPGIVAIEFPALLIVTGSVFVAAAITMVKMLSRTENTTAIVTWMLIFLTPASLIPALFVWTWPGWDTLALLAALGAVGTIAQVAVTRAYVAADATLVLPFDYARLPFAALAGWIAFGETLDAWTWVGAAVMGSATVYMVHRETRLARGSTVPVGSAVPVGEPVPVGGAAPVAGEDRSP